MNKRTCRHCNKPLASDMRGGAEFCNSTCRSQYWRTHKRSSVKKDNSSDSARKAIPAEGLSETIRGVVDSIERLEETIQEAQAPVQSDVSSAITEQPSLKIKLELAALEMEQKQLSQKIAAVSRQIGLLKGEFYEGVFDRYLFLGTVEKHRLLASAQSELATLKQQLQIVYSTWAKLFCEHAQPEKSQAKIEPKSEPASVEVPKVESPRIVISAESKNSPSTKTSGKVISSKDLREKTYACLNFSGKWFDLIGKPAVVFHAAVHGKPGEGKSTFCFQWAHYLAENFGRVVYISAEEGFSKTLRDKLINNKAESSSLCFADLRSCNEITSEIGRYDFHFIIIDSLDTLKIDAVKLKQLREHYPQSAFITISQSTKDGKMRGSQEIIHDSDVEIRVDNGVATTAKNRFREKGKIYNVFSENVPSKVEGKMEPPRNVV